MRRIVLALMTALLAATATQAQTDAPFGIGGGTPLADLPLVYEGDTPSDKGWVLVEPPIKNPLFDFYSATLNADGVMCAVTAQATGMPSDMSSTFSMLHAELLKKYPALSKISLYRTEGPHPGVNDLTSLLMGHSRYEFSLTGDPAIYASLRESFALNDLAVRLTYRFPEFGECSIRDDRPELPNNSTGL